MCAGDKPEAERQCGSACQWQTSDWTVCEGRGQPGTETRTSVCMHGEGYKLDDTKCTEDKELGEKPPLERDCCIPLTHADFEGVECGAKEDGCGNDLAFDTCTADFSCKEDKCACEERDVEFTRMEEHVTIPGDQGTFDFSCPSGTVLSNVAS